MKKKLIVMAEKEEMKLLEKLDMPDLIGVSVLITGVGGLNIIESLRGVPYDTEIINIGYAGSNNLEGGKFYSVQNSTLFHPNVDYPEPDFNCKIDLNYPVADCYTSCDFVTSDQKDCLFDMELAFINAMCFRTVRSYKYVSDHCNYEEYKKTLYEE